MKLVYTAILLLVAGGLDVDEFQQLHQELQTCETEAWRSIPWRTSLLQARQEAAQQGKPIFVWAMDGNPLGCT